MLRTVPSSAGRSGFSLMELVMVIAIVGVLGAVAAPRYAAALHRYRAQAAAHRLAADLELARERAAASSETHTLTVAADGRSYTISPWTSPDGSETAYTVRLDAEPYLAAVVETHLGGDRRAEFNGYGVPRNGGGSIVVGVGDARRSVAIRGGSGNVGVE